VVDTSALRVFSRSGPVSFSVIFSTDHKNYYSVYANRLKGLNSDNLKIFTGLNSDNLKIFAGLNSIFGT